MSINPNDNESLKQSNIDAIKKQRTRARERTPDASKNNNGKYPLRQVHEHIGGHRTVMDSTPGNRIVETAHGSGTFQQWSEDGTEIKVVVGNAHHHLKEGYTLTVDQNGDIKIEGHARVSVGGGCHVEVRGDVSIVSTGNITTYASGNYNIVAGKKVNILGRGGVNISTDSSINMKAASDLNTDIMGNETNKIGGTREANISGTDKTSSGGTMDLTAPRINLN